MRNNSIQTASKQIQSECKNKLESFGISSLPTNSKIDNQNVVKYLGLHLDKIFILKSSHKRNNYFSRPILTYGCAIWFNISPLVMEKIRIFERKCLRSCPSLYISPQTEYLKYIPNKKLYNEANLIRRDNFIIKLIRYNIQSSLQ